VASGVVEQPSQDAESEQKKIPGAGARRSQHVQRLLDAENLPTFLNHLLTQQAIMVAGAEAAAFLIEGGAETFSLRPIAHIREDNSDSETRAAALNAFQELIRPCVEQGKDGVLEVGPGLGSLTQNAVTSKQGSDGYGCYGRYGEAAAANRRRPSAVQRTRGASASTSTR